VTDNQKPNFFRRVAQGAGQAIQETIGELRKVSWPTRQEATNLTLIVIAVIFIMSLFLGLLDFIYSQAFRLLLGA
jgi:preprotein translocase subunit SecE